MMHEYKYMKKILFGFGILLPFLALATTFPSSGIDFATSSILITGPSGASCLQEDLPQTFSLEEMGISETTTTLSDFGDWSDDAKRCFQQAGTYTMEITIFDKAGNTTSLPEETFIITSATPDENTSGFAVTCSNTVANASDTCDIELRLRDEFNNDVVQSLPGIELSAPLTEDEEDANLKTKFRAGLRIQGSDFIPANPITFSWNSTSPFATTLSAIAPSIQQVSTGITDTYLASVVNRTIPFSLDNLSEINTNGSVSSSHFSFSDLPVSLRFDAPVAIVPGFEEERISFGDPIVMNSTVDRPGAIPADSITSILKSISSHLFLDPAAVPDENGALPGGDPLNETFIFAPVVNEDIKSIEKIIFADNAFDEPKNISLITDASYSLAGEEVQYPAGAIGQPLVDAAEDDGYPITSVVGFNLTGVDIRNIGVSIEGIVIGDYDQMYLVGGDKNKITALSSLHSVDIREKIIKNAYQLIRNATNIKTDATEFNWNLFDTQDVVVLDLSDKDLANATLTLPQHDLPSGQKTLIVVNGNVLFTGNHEYADTSNDSFGLILLRDKAGPEPERGNIFVHSDVQKLSGTLFADGSFFNGDTASVASANSGARIKQLRLIGSLLARNTVGGSRRVGAGYFFTPWDTTGLAKAKQYDLHEIRQFDYDDDATRDANCVKNGADCEENIAAFIMRLDQKSTLLPPPGFLTD
jgi:hypothetical protein